MALAAVRPLPGVRFEPRAAPLDEALPRMDIAVFVGFAARGPIDLPVAVESVPQYEAVFGGDAPLAWDAERGEMTQAMLAPSVRAFFRNGGQRCWIVRVAGADASAGRFALPGLLAVHAAGDGGLPALAPAFAIASSRGSWSDALRVCTALRQRPLRPALSYGGGAELFLATGDGVVVATGDLLRLQSAAGDTLVFAAVRAVEPALESPPAAGLLRVSLGTTVAFVLVRPDEVPPSRARARLFNREAIASPAAASATGAGVDVAARIEAAALLPSVDSPPSAAARPLSLLLDLSPAQAPPAGSLLRIDVGAETWWQVVERLGIEPRGFDNAAPAVRIDGPAWRVASGSSPALGPAPRIERLSFDLQVWDAGRGSSTLRDLGFAPAHPRYWNALERDEVRHGEARSGALAAPSKPPQAAPADGAPHFPLAGSPGEPLFVPLGMPVQFGTGAGPVATDRTRMERDGLARFGRELFLDEELERASVDSFIGQADHLRYLSGAARPLRGIHAALGWYESTLIEEATLIAVPDAVHRPWEPIAPQDPAPALTETRIPQPDWWRFLPCERGADGKPRPVPLAEHLNAPGDFNVPGFIAADVREVAVPTWQGGQPVADRSGSFRLAWSLPEADAEASLEESSRPDFADARQLYRGRRNEFTLYGRSPGAYYYRIRAFVGRNGSHWSAARVVTVGQVAEARLLPAAQFDPAPLLAVHRALMRMCAARGDLLAVLGLPGHFRDDDAIAYVRRLTATAVADRVPGVPPLAVAEARATSYAALYHPWLAARLADGRITPMCPDGTVAGVLAARAAARGAWIAPANEPLREVLALDPMPAPAQFAALQQAQVNVIRREPRGFVCLNADTLSTDPDLRPIGVRRLLILLRRLALRRGATYVFEPMSGAFRRLVQRGFEAVLGDLFRRGAFAGRTAADSFQVSTGESPASGRDLDSGRFIVEIKVAPALPLRFLSIRLLQAGERLTVTEGR